MSESKVLRLELFVSKGPSEAADLVGKVRGALAEKLQWLEVQPTELDSEETKPCYCIREMPELWPGADVVSVILKGTDSESQQAIAKLEEEELYVTRGDDQVKAHKEG